MPVRDTKGTLKSAAPGKGDGENYDEGVEGHRPRNIPANTAPTDGFSLEVDAKAKSQYPTLEAAMNVGAELKRKFPMLQVTIYDAAARIRTLVEPAK